jgi:pilus assembly protein Flp/PilA
LTCITAIDILQSRSFKLITSLEDEIMKLNTITSILDDESGATAIEYGLIAALVSVAGIVAFGLVGTALNDVFTNVEGQLRGAIN